MKTKNLIPMALLAMSGWSLPAGAGEPVAPPPPPAVQPSSDWQFLMTLPGWGAGLSGDIGVGGFKPISVDVGLEEIVDHLDMAAALTLEARHDRWGFILDGMYLKMSGDGETPGRLLNSVSLDVEEVLAEATRHLPAVGGEPRVSGPACRSAFDLHGHHPALRSRQRGSPAR